MCFLESRLPVATGLWAFEPLNLLDRARTCHFQRVSSGFVKMEGDDWFMITVASLLMISRQWEHMKLHMLISWYG